MAKKLIEVVNENMMLGAWISMRLVRAQKAQGYEKQFISIAMCMYVDGRVLLKDLAKYSDVLPSNLCVRLKKFEQDGLVLRQVDDLDRRNTWYSLTPKGKKAVEDAMEMINGTLAEMLSVIDKGDAAKLTEALGVVNGVLAKVKLLAEKNSRIAI